MTTADGCDTGRDALLAVVKQMREMAHGSVRYVAAEGNDELAVLAEIEVRSVMRWADLIEAFLEP